MSTFSLQKSSKIIKRPDYLKIDREGSKLRTKNFIILYLRNSTSRSRFGITATKKIGGAVQRNRVKRLIREFFRLNQHHFKGPTDFIFIAGKGSINLGYTEIRDELLSALGKKGMLRALYENSC